MTVNFMIKFLIQVVVVGGLLLYLPHFIHDFQISQPLDAFIFAIVLSLLNRVLTPFLIAISFPLTVLSAGLFVVLINIFVFWLASLVSVGVTIASMQAVLCGGFIFCLVNLFITRRLALSI